MGNFSQTRGKLSFCKCIFVNPMENFLQFLKFRKDDCEYPTLLHFSAAHGLEQLTCALLDCPGAQAALQIRLNFWLKGSVREKINGI